MGVTLGLVALAACSGGDDDGGQAEAPTETLAPLHAERGERAGIYDDQGRQVLLRGVNLNALGDYYQANQDHPQVVPADEDDVAAMAEQGFNVVRLVLS